MEKHKIEYQTLTQDIAKIQQAFLAKVYGWMMIGLLLTAFVAYYVATSEEILSVLLANKLLFYALVFAPIGLVIFLSARLAKMKASTAISVFLLYSALTGLMLSVILLVYTASSIVTTFLTASLMFGAMGLFGYFTKRDLTGMGSFMMMGLFGIVIASVINIFVGSEGLSWIISYVGVIVFTGLAAYDTQKMKANAYVMLEGNEMATKGAIFGALQLYMNFINLFLMLLRLMGDRK